jgi:hypothetical protein
MNAILNSMLAATELEVGGMPAGEFFGGMMGMVIIVFGIVLAVCALLMPLFVVAIHGLLKRMLRENQRLNGQVEMLTPRVSKMQMDLQTLKNRWMQDGEE